MSAVRYSIVVPVYRSEKTLRELYERINDTFARVGDEYELILVEDCGGDASWQVMQSLRRSDKRVKIIRLSRNFGQHNALMCGFAFASGQFIITMDDDLQNPPEEIEKLIKAIVDSDYDVVYGVPDQKRQSAFRNLASSLYSLFNSVTFRNVAGLRISNFRIIRKSVVEQILTVSTPNPIVGHLILKVTQGVGAVTVAHHKRIVGGTTYSMRKLVNHFLNGVLYNSTLPLQLVLAMGLACLVISSILGLYCLVASLAGSGSVSGFTLLALMILFFAGVIMLSLGVVGEYLLKIIQEVGGHPQYVIKDKEV